MTEGQKCGGTKSWQIVGSFILEKRCRISRGSSIHQQHGSNVGTVTGHTLLDSVSGALHLVGSLRLRSSITRFI